MWRIAARRDQDLGCAVLRAPRGISRSVSLSLTALTPILRSPAVDATQCYRPSPATATAADEHAQLHDARAPQQEGVPRHEIRRATRHAARHAGGSAARGAEAFTEASQAAREAAMEPAWSTVLQPRGL